MKTKNKLLKGSIHNIEIISLNAGYYNADDFSLILICLLFLSATILGEMYGLEYWDTFSIFIL